MYICNPPNSDAIFTENDRENDYNYFFLHRINTTWRTNVQWPHVTRVAPPDIAAPMTNSSASSTTVRNWAPSTNPVRR